MAKARSRVTDVGRAREHGRRSGYMLVEMVAALALTALLLGFVLPLAPGGTGSARFLGIVTASAAMLRDARSEAIARGSTVSAVFDGRTRLLGMGGRTVAIPRDVELDVTAGGNCPSDGARVARIVFRADGTNCGGVFRFARAGRVVRVRVDWVNGRVDVVAGG